MVRGTATPFSPTQLSGAFTPSEPAHGAEVPSWARSARVVVKPTTPGDTVVLSIYRRYAAVDTAYIVCGTTSLTAAGGYEVLLEVPPAGDHLRIVPDIAVSKLALYFDDLPARGS